MPMTPERLQLEKQVLASKLPGNIYRFMDMDQPEPYLIMAAKTNRGKIYTIKIMLNEFPNSKPEVYVNKMLYTKTGRAMDSPSAHMHTLSSRNDCTQICHYGDNAWTPMLSLYKVYVRCRLWLEIYDLHLETGNDMDYYLDHAY